MKQRQLQQSLACWPGAIRETSARCHGWGPLPAADPTLGARPGGPAHDAWRAGSLHARVGWARDGWKAWLAGTRGVAPGHPVLEAG
jgi:hypothetical protein